MDSEQVAPSEETYWFFVEWRAEKATAELMEDLVIGDMDEGSFSAAIEAINQSVTDWWSTKDHSTESLRSVLEYGDYRPTNVDEHVERVAVGTCPGSTCKVDPEDVLERLALVTFRHDVIGHVFDQLRNPTDNE